MKHISKILSIILVLILTLSCISVFAEEKTEEETKEYKYSDYIKSIAKNIALFCRYDGIVENNLYLAALDAIIEENPELYENAVKAMVESVDENSAYYNKEEAKAFMENIGDEVVGIGISILSQESNLVVSQPIPGSPADKAGIKTGDIIIAANDINLVGMDLDEAVEYIRGEAGTTVKITVKRSGMNAPMSFSIVREKVMHPSLDFELIERDGKKIARITVYSFTENVAEQFKNALDKVDAAGTKKLIIDLRDNGGGYYDQALQIADMLLPKGKVISFEDHKIDVLDQKYETTGIGRNYEIAVLINGYSASASEVLTAALVENGAAVSIGTTSFGKGTVQSMYDVPLDAMMKFTVAYYLTPDGNNIHGKGITPMAVVENKTVPVSMEQFGTFNLIRTYRLGDMGAEVKIAKELLNAIGIFYGEINEIYDENLQASVTVFQEAMGLYPYGVLDLTTQMNIYEKVKSLKVEVDEQLEAAIDSF